ncbi:hypothetical protein J2T12_001500 [Paenibacillus anaericanus]|uniref:hypothetical protein n=1 Tax=Paenibacillus anaericanus TaxID=170367 RepID=UPI00277F55B2|nr:hypothetical protein [Paenibacillus anaericanus]MDQ0088094.1 hypothetical protein [Paenibacillus anaericanus]
MNGKKVYYLGIHQNMLEPVSLSYLCFGALWYEDNNQRYIVGYGFGENKIEVLRQFSNHSSCEKCMDPNIVREVYRSIRDKQQKQDWSTRLRFPLSNVFRAPWKDVASGWYIVRSRKIYPLHLSAIHKKRYRIWLEHTAVCESESELFAFIEKVKFTHNVDLKLMESSGGTLHGSE